MRELEALFDEAQLTRRATIQSQLAIDLEELLARSFPRHISRDQLREWYHSSLADDALGLHLQRTERGVFGAYDTAVIVAEPARL